MTRFLLLILLLTAPLSQLFAQAVAPTRPDSLLQLTSVSCKWAKVSWRTGNGTYRVVVLADDPSGPTAPTQGTAYIGSEYFMAGSYVGNGGYVLYAGTGSAATFRQLQVGHKYRALVYAYNQDSRGRVAYNLARVPDTLRFTTPACPDVSPTRPASTLRATPLDCSTLRLTCHPGNGQSRLFVLRKNSAGTAAGDVGVSQGTLLPVSNLYARAFPLNPGLYGVYAGSDSTVVVYGLAPDQRYQVAVYEFNTVPGPDGYPDGVTPYYTQTNYPVFFPATGACVGSEPGKSAVDNQSHQTANLRVVPGSLAARSVTLTWHPAITPAHRDATGGLVPAGPAPEDGVGSYVVIRNALAFGALPLPLQNTVPQRVSAGYGQGSPARPGQDSVYSVKLTTQWNDTTVTITGLRPSSVYTADVFTFRYPDDGSLTPYTYFLSVPQASVSFFTPAAPLPVRLVAFTLAHAPGGPVRLSWSTATEVTNAGFAIERSPDSRAWTPLAFVPGSGTSAAGHAYALATPYVGAAYYRLRQQDLDGSATYSPVRYLAGDETAAGSGLRAYPNPTADQFTITGADPARPVEVVNVLGQVVRTLPAGQTTGTLGGQFPAGVYVLRQQARCTRLVLR